MNRKTLATQRRLQRLTQLSAKVSDGLTQFAEVDLGRTYDYGGLSCGGESPKAASKKHFPTLYASGLKTDPGTLPREGTARIKYRLRSRSFNEDENGKTQHGFDIEVLSFDPAKEEKKKEGAATKIEMSRRSLRETRFGLDPRTRDGQGQFVAPETGGADPVTMRQAYGNPVARPAKPAPLPKAPKPTGGGLLVKLKQKLRR